MCDIVSQLEKDFGEGRIYVLSESQFKNLKIVLSEHPDVLEKAKKALGKIIFYELEY